MPCVGHGSFPSLSQGAARGRGCPPHPCTLTCCGGRDGGRGGSSQAELVLQGEVDVVPLRRPIHRLRGHHQVGVLSHVQDLPRRVRETSLLRSTGSLRMWGGMGDLQHTLGFGELRGCEGSPESTTCLG